MKLITQDNIHRYKQDGFVIIRSLFSLPEAALLYQVAVNDEQISKHSYDLNDSAGKKTKLALWFTPGDDTYGLLTRTEKLINAVDQLLEGDSEVCHFHSKLMQKEPHVGGAWEWHQDYGYWYKNGFLYPDQMLSVMVALTEATVENGCLQVIPGSHKLGRVEHAFSGEQNGADMRFVDEILKTKDVVYMTLKPGDVLFFHSNLLHRSDSNNSDMARWSLISAYNRSGNIPFNEKSVSCITPVSTVSDSAPWSSGLTGKAASADFLIKNEDVTLKSF
ncbi:MAG TPA: phytanoyl-CoA dioxygenase family protein [Cellvibrio sp.]|nr:phytanoyl-CoA dioxygenase family protein [Cellvibrio sp.]